MEIEVRQGIMRPGWYWWAAMLASSLVFALGAMFISLHAQAESERKWCSVVSTLDEAYRQQPPATPLGQRIAADMAALRKSLRCS